MKRRTEITIETERIVVVNINVAYQPRPLIWCSWCAAHVVPLTIDEATMEWRVSSLTLFHQIESGLVHYVETADGLLLICPHSIDTASSSSAQLSRELPASVSQLV